MSITPERLDELSLEVASTIDDGSGEQYFVDQDGWISDFARALLSAVEAELKPVGYLMPHYEEMPPLFMRHPLPKGYSEIMGEKLISLPLIKEKS